jgi:hypothetical protein
MATRSAEATIKGYYYQFDTSILKLLELVKDEDEITIEGIEDIDINSTDETTIQCKYLSKPNFINSAVREPITLMLDHFFNPKTSNNYNYVLYAHFENEVPGNEPIIDLKKLKEILSYKENKIEKHYEIEKSISDAQLNSFLLQFKFVFGIEFYKQQSLVINKLKILFSCTEFEADSLYYNNSLRIVIDKAINKGILNRKISKKDFLNKINCSQQLFNEWFIKLRSKNEYLKLVSQNLKFTKALVPNKIKYIFIGQDILESDNSELPLVNFIENLISKYYKLNFSLRDSKPITLILDTDSIKLKTIKEELIKNEILFNDGYEEILFSNSVFNKEPIINTSKNGIKLSKSSYVLKIISKQTLQLNFTDINSPNVYLYFSKEDNSLKFSKGQYFDIKHCTNLKEINKLVTI